MLAYLKDRKKEREREREERERERKRERERERKKERREKERKKEKEEKKKKSLGLVMILAKLLSYSFLVKVFLCRASFCARGHCSVMREGALSGKDSALLSILLLGNSSSDESSSPSLKMK